MATASRSSTTPRRKLDALNGCGRAPAALTLDVARSHGATIGDHDGISVTVPGAVAGWTDLLARHGRLTLAQVLEPAIRLADEGFDVGAWAASVWDPRRSIQAALDTEAPGMTGVVELDIDGQSTSRPATKSINARAADGRCARDK